MRAERVIREEAALDRTGEEAGRGRARLRRRDLATDSAMKGILILLVTGLALLYLIPLYWLFVTSIRVPDSLYNATPEFIPTEISFLSWQRLFNHPLLTRWFLNSTLIAFSATVGTVVVSAVAGYVFAKMRFPAKTILFWLVLLTMMLPGQATLVPMYVMMLRLGWLDTYWPMIIPFFADAFGLFLMKQYMQTLPTSLIDAARLDGCSEFKIFRRIVLPLSKSGLAVLSLFTFVGHWNSFLWPLLMLRRNDMQTLQVGLTSMSRSSFDVQLLMASAALAALPPIAIFLLLQRHFREGLTVGALKG